MNRLRMGLSWIDRNLLFLLSVFLLAFIPLFPKIPLFDALPGYIVKVRIEDFFVILTGVVWLRDVITRRIIWNTSYFWFVIMYAVAGLLSIGLGILLLQTIPFEPLHVGKSGLHFVRYLEYFSLFFFFFSSIKSKRHIIATLAVIVITLLGVVGFGLGQKYAQFPVYSTMNREYSKGGKLYLQPGAKPQSTFAGHYDLAAYLVLILPLLFSFSLGKIRQKFSLKNWILAAVLFAVHLSGLFMLVLTSSATALGAYGIGMLCVTLLHLFKLPTRKAQATWGLIGIMAALIGLSGVWMIAPAHTKEKALGLFQKSVAGSAPSDLIGNGYVQKTISTAQPDGSIKYETILEKSTWSDNALRYGISMGIRLDTLWPQALLGAARSPLSGSGYGTLAMLETKGFVEADSTDNNFLRTLGETGLFGFLAFYGFVFFIGSRVFLAAKDQDEITSSLSIGFFGSVVGLLITAVYLDVFAASKVAFTFWALSGLALKAGYLTRTESLSTELLLRPLRRLRTHLRTRWPLYATLILAIFLLHQNPFLSLTPTKDIESARAGLENLTAARCFLTQGNFSLCRNSGLTGLPHFSLYSLILVPFFSLTKIYGVFAYVNLGLVLLVSLAVFQVIRKKASPFLTFGILMSLVSIAALLQMTHLPLTNIQFAAIVILFPLVALIVSRFRLLTWPLALLVAAGVISSIALDPMLPRFRPTVPNYAYESITTANGILPRTMQDKTYLLSALNPYFVDLYTSDRYTLLPLSDRQEYAENAANVWGETLTDTLIETGDVYVSDYNAQSTQAYATDFDKIKAAYDLHYVRLGCNETCNIYSIDPGGPVISIDPLSVFTQKYLSVNDLAASYQFAVVPNLFYAPLQDSTITYDTRVFGERLTPFSKTAQDFAVITGDAMHKPEKVHAGFIQGLARNTKYPILYAQGNEKIMPVKYLPGNFQSFFTDTEFFILLDVSADGSISDDEKLLLYDAFLKLEKLPAIKSLFIIAHDLNWQDTSSPKNALHVVTKKLAAFPAVNAYILTANHGENLIKADTWYETRQDGNITYAAGLTAGNSRDVYIQVNVENGNVTIKEMKLEE
jgi:hypothetical protein